MLQTPDSVHSEAAVMADIFKLSDAGASVIQIRTREPVRTALILRKNLVDGEETTYREWDAINGFRVFSAEDATDNTKDGGKEDFFAALGAPMSELRNKGSRVYSDDKKVHYFVYINPQPFMENPFVIELVQQYAAILPSTNVCVILVTPETTLSSIPPGNILVGDMRTPTVHELAATLNSMLDNSLSDFTEPTDIGEDDVMELCQLGLGLTLFEFETYAALAIVGAAINRAPQFTKDMLRAGIAVGKTEVVKQSEILELYPTISMDEVGGMQRLKDWLNSRKDCYSDEARDFGIEPPKGVVTVGVPGSGKSLVAKAIATVFGVPLVRMDFARVFSKYVGDSESRVRAALKMVEAMAPCVLFVDEIDKGMGGAAGGGDSGTSSRVLGTYLTWLNDCKAPVFNMVTANKVEGLPPELLRKGRFDQIFSVGMPNRVERLEVLHIHLRKRGHDIGFDKMQNARFIAKSDGYVPAEIEQSVRDALILAFNAGEALGMEHIIAALEGMVPMSKSNAAQISAILEWATNNAVPVNYELGADDFDDSKSDSGAAAAPAGARRIGRSNRVQK